MSDPANAPVGSIIGFAGNYPLCPGWLICDGQPCATAQYPELYAAIGTSFGAPTDDGRTFCLPNFAGQFLRGVTGKSPRDKHSALRSFPQAQMVIPGASGNAVGSIQKYATAQPGNQFKASIRGLPDDNHSCHSPAGAPDDVAISHSDQKENHWTLTDAGGDSESRPINKSVWFLIKAQASDAAGNPVLLPAGAVIASAGPDPASIANFSLCDGAQADRYNTALYAAIGTANGGDGKESYYLPDYRGYFLRGTGIRDSFDPDDCQRAYARPDLPKGQQGAHGGSCGSSQGWATGLPQETPFQTNFLWCPDDGVHAYNSAGARCGLTNWGTSIRVAVTGERGDPNAGGDAETRPVNVAVDWMIKTAAAGDVPVGAVVAFGGELPLPTDEQKNWRPCHGGTVAKSDPAYASLSAAIGTIYGTDPAGAVVLPDYRGVFLRGHNRDEGKNPDTKRTLGSLQSYATGVPKTPFTATPANLPAHGEYVFNEGSHDPSAWPDGDYTNIVTNTKGGDDETRPTNAYVEFLIRVM